jgi:hypothetical protein
MVVDPRISDNELAAINAAAVTREYRVQPHLGMFTTTCQFLSCLTPFLQIIALYLPSTGKNQIKLCPCIFNRLLCRPLVVLDNVKVETTRRLTR